MPHLCTLNASDLDKIKGDKSYLVHGNLHNLKVIFLQLRCQLPF